MKFDSVTIPDRDVHEVKQRLKRALGGAPGLSELLERKGAENFDFWVAKDGIVWIGENGTGGREVETTVNFFTVFPAYAPPPDPTLAAEANARGDLLRHERSVGHLGDESDDLARFDGRQRMARRADPAG